jgi:hypothetical protein
MRHKITSPRVFIDTLESFYEEYGAYTDIIASALGDYMKTDWRDYVGSYSDACNVRVILCLSYNLDLPPLDAIEWNVYVNHNSSYLGES